MARLLVCERSNKLQKLLSQRFSGESLAIDGVRAVKALSHKIRQCAYDYLVWHADGLTLNQARRLGWLERVSRDFPGIQILVLSDTRTLEATSKERRLVSRLPVQLAMNEEQLLKLLENAMHADPLTSMAAEPSRDPVPTQFESMLGISGPMLEVFQRIMDAASADVPVLITGATGTGKDLVASAIHKRSKRRDAPYIAVHTGAMATELIAAELFGREKGAYTGAFESSQGRFEQADGGTIFLDEISTMDEKAQISLLRVLETKTFRHIGGEKDIRVDVRVIAATNENLEEAVKEKRFREDLFYRLEVFHIHLPPLRERPGAVRLLSKHFLSQFSRVYNKNVDVLSAEALHRMARYPWPGNVRELKNVIQRAVLIAKGEELTVDLLPRRIREAVELAADAPTETPPIHLGMTLQDVEKEFISMTLSSADGNKRKAAAILGISRRALYNKLKRFGLG